MLQVLNKGLEKSLFVVILNNGIRYLWLLFQTADYWVNIRDLGIWGYGLGSSILKQSLPMTSVAWFKTIFFYSLESKKAHVYLSGYFPKRT